VCVISWVVNYGFDVMVNSSFENAKPRIAGVAGWLDVGII
jgi:hypothetical protein